MIKLRDYQKECLDKIQEVGYGKYIIQMATGLGKTVIFTHLINNQTNYGRCLILSHREELVNQPLKYITKTKGVEMGKQTSNHEEVISSCVASLVRRYKKFSPDYFGLIIVDECFPAGTIIDGKCIENLHKDDIITSYNHRYNKLEKKKILRTFKSIPNQIVIVKLSNGKEIVCTGEHPFFTKQGYIPANKLINNYEVLCMRERSTEKKQKTCARLLFIRMFFKAFKCCNVKNKQEICNSNKSKNERKQSNEEARNKRKSIKKIKRNWSLSKNKMRKWFRINSATTKFIDCIKRFITICRISNSNKNEKRKRISDVLQSGYSNCRQNDSDRNRWKKSLPFRKTRIRQKERQFFDWVRVESVEVQKQTSDRKFGGLCKDGYVYNIEVEDNNNYFVNSTLVHNCHHSAAKSYRNILEYFKPKLLLGFTATPNRSDNQRLDKIYDKIIYKYDLLKGIKNGYLSNIRCKRIYVKYDLKNVRSQSGDYKISDLENELIDSENPQSIAKIYKEHAIGSTLIFGVSVKHCEEIQKNIPDSVVVTAETKNRSKIIQDFTAGKIKCIINCMIFTEGTDIPKINTIIVARPTKNESLYCQIVGRGLRLYEGKEHLNLIDCVGVSTDLNLCTAPSLLGIDYNDEKVPKKENELAMDVDLFNLPELIEKKEDHPDNWKINYKIVNLWAKKQNYQLHNVNWYKHSDGHFSLSLKNKNITTGPINELGNIEFNRKQYEAQNFFDRVFIQLNTKYSDQKYIWDLNIMKSWGYKPASEAQIKQIQKVLPDYNTYSLNKLQASQILNKIYSK